MKAQIKYWNAKNTDELLFCYKSLKPIKCDNEELNCIVKTIKGLYLKEKQHKNNISKMERKALEELKNDQRIIIKEADKGGTLVFSRWSPSWWY